MSSGEAVGNSAQLATRESSKRRSSRIVQAVPLSVTGVDALGRPFVERTSTIVVNCHGCRYQSKHYILKNMWVTLEVPHSEADHSPRQVRGRVTWVQRPHGVHKLFQVGVELEVPGNLWSIAFSPPDWIPFPDTPFSDTNRQEAEVSQREPAEPASHRHTSEREKAGTASRDHLRMVPPGGEGELSAALAGHLEILVGDPKQHLHETIRESATWTLSAEARPLVAALYAQFQEAERRATPGSGEGLGFDSLGQARIAEQDSLKKIRDEVGKELGSRLRALREQWNLEISEIARQTSERVAAELGRLEQERRGEFEQRVESKLRQTVDNLELAAGEAWSKVAHAQENLAELRKNAEEAAVPLRAIEQTLRAQAEISRVQLASIETAARHFEERIASALDLERELGAHLDRAGEALRGLQGGIGDAEATLHAHEDRIIKVSERTAETVIERLEKVAKDLESNLEQSAKVLAAKWLDEIDSKATEATHTTFEALFKTAEWYEKKVQAQMQAGAEKSLAQSAESLREKASETFRLFGTELDHYSRSYVEHTQSQFADGARENLDVISRQAGEIAATASASLSEDARKHIEVVLAELRSRASGALSDAGAAMENHAAAIRATLESEARRFSSEFRESLTQQSDQAVARAQQEAALQAEASRHDLRMQGELQASELRQAFTLLGNQAIDEYRKRLEDASDSWLSATVGKLNEESKERIESLAKTAESRLRETCVTVFASVGETLRSRLLEAATLPANPQDETGSENQPRGAAESGSR